MNIFKSSGLNLCFWNDRKIISIFIEKCLIPNYATMGILGTPSRNDVARGSTSVQARDGSKKKQACIE